MNWIKVSMIFFSGSRFYQLPSSLSVVDTLIDKCLTSIDLPCISHLDVDVSF